MTPTPGKDALARLKVGVEAALEIAIEDLQSRAVNDAPIRTGHLRRSAETNVRGFEGGRTASAELRFTAPYAAAQEVGRIVYEETRERPVRAYERTDPRLGHLRVRAHVNPIGPIDIELNARQGKSRYVEDNLKAMVPRYREFIALAARRSVEAG